MLSDFLPVLIQAVIALGFAGVALGLSVLLGKSGSKGGVKDSVYECGMVPLSDSTPRFSVKFYLVAMLFVLFDIEVVFLYPWALQFQSLIAESSAALWSALGFIGILSVAYVYALKKGALDWTNS